MNRMRGQTGYALLGTALVHGGLLLGLFLGSPPEPRPDRRPPVQIRVVSRPKPPPRPPEPPPAEARKPEPPRPELPRPKTRPQERPQAPVDPPEPVATEPPPAEPPRPIRRFSVAMEATVSTGGVAVPTAPAGQAFAAGAKEGSPDGERVLGAPVAEERPVLPERRPFSAAQVSRPPRLLEQPSLTEMKRLYPEVARKDGLEADVSLRILVGTSGEVVEVKLVRGAGQGFDEVAMDLVRKFRFEAGTRDGRPVSVWIPWTYKFRLEG